MDSANGDRDVTSNELLRTQAHIWNHIFSFITSMCLKSAIQLGIPDLIHDHGRPMTLHKLISVLHIQSTKAHCIHRLMRVLVHSGFFELGYLEEESDCQIGYSLTGASQLLVNRNPSSVAPLALAMLDALLMGPWHYLGTWLGDGEDVGPSPCEMAHGMAMWELTRRNPEFHSLFDKAMASDARLIGKVVEDICGGVFERLSSVVNVGGGSGTMGKAITEPFPHLECAVLDLPHVVDGLVGSERLKFVGGDMFAEIPPRMQSYSS